MDLDTASRCVARLVNGELLESDVLADAADSDVVATDIGNIVAKKILRQL